MLVSDGRLQGGCEIGKEGGIIMSRVDFAGIRVKGLIEGLIGVIME